MEHAAPLIDFHTHILPGADHGSSGTHETMNQMQIIQRYGVDTVVATPHFYPNLHRVDRFLPLVEDCLARFRSAESPFTGRLCLGAEVLYCHHLDQMPDLDSLCIRGTDLLLLELPMGQLDADIFETVEALLRRYTVVLAHIDRYIADSEDIIDGLIQRGALAQINAYSLFSGGMRRRLSPYLKSDRVVALGSDLHGEDEKGYKKFATADKKIGDLRDRIMLRAESLLRNAEKMN